LKERINKITAILDEKKAQDIDVINLAGKNYLVDMVIIATTLNAKHGLSLITYLKDLKNSSEEIFRIEEGNHWTIVDLGDILIHLMSSEYRQKYQMEEFLNDIKTN
jgi:ribosome silencing factor RsfS/YbeB/iojap